jgi:signal peptidase I
VKALRFALRAVLAVWLLVLIGCVGVLATAWVTGRELNVVDTGSMEPDVPEGALAVMSPADRGPVERGDVVAFTAHDDPDQLVLHRVVDVIETEDGAMLRTRGDANAVTDTGVVSVHELAGRLDFSVPRLGIAVRALQPPVGPLVLVGVPLLVFGGSEVRAFRSRRRERASVGAADGHLAST